METKYVRVSQEITGSALAADLAINPETPAFFLIAGADLASFDDLGIVERHLEVFARAAIETGAVVVDGGTNSGAMGMLDAILGGLAYQGCYLGFVPSGKVLSEGRVDQSVLGPNHSHFVLVEGDQYGDELCPMFDLIGEMGRSAPVVGMLINGGQGSLDEVEQAVEHGKPIIVMKGSGRLADELAGVIESPPWFGKRKLRKLVRAGSFEVFDLADQPEKFKELLMGCLRDRPSN